MSPSHVDVGVWFSLLCSSVIPLMDGNRTFVADVRWAMEKHTALQAKSTLLTRRRGNARSAWNRLQAREDCRVYLPSSYFDMLKLPDRQER